MIAILELRSATGSGGGPEKTILLSAAHADASAFRVSVAYVRNVRDDAFTIAQRARDLGLRFHDIAEPFSYDLRVVAQITRVVRDEHIDLIHAHDYKTNVLALLARSLTGVKLVSTAHGYVTRSPKLDLYYTLDKIALRGFDHVMVVSPDLLEEMLGWGLSPAQVTYLPNGVDTEQFRRRPGVGGLRPELGLRPNQPLVGGVGRLSPEKDFDSFLKIARRVRQHLPDAHFVIVGEGPERDRLRDAALRAGLNGGLTLLGQRSDIIEVYQSLDLFLLTSLREGLPNVVLEAMSMEVPVLATRVAGVGELIEDGVSGYLFQPRDVTGMSRMTADLLQDSEQRAAVARKARATVCSRFAFLDRVRKLEAIYREVIGRT